MEVTLETSSKKKTKTDKSAASTDLIRRRFVPEGVDPYAEIKWTKRSSKITDSNGATVFEMKDIEVPESWSQLATDISVSKYFRRAGVPGTGWETSVRQLVYRVAHTIRIAGEAQGGYFANKAEADIFEDELAHILLHQKGAFNSPVWFNCGLFHVYGIEGRGGHFVWDFKTQSPQETQSAYKNPQCSACFIQSVDDDLMSIFELVKKEAKIFKYGSGTGTNFSSIRGKDEKLAGGGTSSGLMSFLEVLDRGAGATKSGGTTRRAAKMVCLDMDHPEIEDFITWKQREEEKVKALVAGGYSADFNGEAYKTIAGQNSNNSVRLSDKYMNAVLNDGEWSTIKRTNGEVDRTYNARYLWDKIGQAAWTCADPGVQFNDTINRWHTSKADGPIRSSNPCSEYMFLDDSACNLSSINLSKFLNEYGEFDFEAYRHTARILFIAQDILVDFSSYPNEKICENSHKYRPLGLGYANLGSLLMLQGIPYDSDTGRAWASALTAIMTGEAYATSARLAQMKSPFDRFQQNAKPMLEVMSMHRKAAESIDYSLLPEGFSSEVMSSWMRAIELGERFGYRNAQATVLAPTGTIGFLMDCDTTGIEPDFALVKFKKLSGGGFLKIVNQSVPSALTRLGYPKEQITEIIEYIIGTQRLDSKSPINRNTLRDKGLTEEELSKIEASLASAFDLEGTIGTWVLGPGREAELLDGTNADQSLLRRLGFTEREIEKANQVLCGHLTIEGAPHLKNIHLPVFDCANKCGQLGERFLSPLSHIKMMAAAQPFLSGAISKTVNMPNEATVSDIQNVYLEAWKLGLKAVAIYRDGCKQSQPLNATSKAKTSQESETPSQPDSNPSGPVAAPIPHSHRRKLPQKRMGLTVEAKVAGHQVYLRTGEYEDGSLGEIFIDMHKEGATLRSILNCFAIAVSMGLQYGVPLEEFIRKFVFTRFEPQGMVDHPNIKQATSIIDYIFRVLAMEYLGKMDYVHIPADPGSLRKAELEAALQRLVEKVGQNSPNPTPPPMMTSHKESHHKDALEQQMESLMGDSPVCNECGHTTVRNGSCYRCMNCGASMGCS